LQVSELKRTLGKLAQSLKMDDKTKGFLQAISSNDDLEVKKYVSEHDINVNIKNPEDQGRTALHVATRNGHKKLVQVLVEDCKADVNLKDDNDEAPIHIAASVYRVDIVKYLLEKGSEYVEDVKHMLNDKNVDRFFAAVESGNVQLVEEILDKDKVDIDSLDKGRYHRTALHMAATDGRENLVKLLVEKYKADVNIADEIGEVPMHNAADKGHVNIVKYLASKNSRYIDDVKDLLDS
jgi:ankyrin repeat protein